MDISFNNARSLPQNMPVMSSDLKATGAEEGAKKNSVTISEQAADAVAGSSGIREIDEKELCRDDELGKLVSAVLSFPAPKLENLDL